MWRRCTATFVALLMISGCTLFSGVKPESVNQSFYLSYALVQSAYDSIQIAIVGGQITTQAQANRLKEPVDETKVSLDAAKAIWDATGNIDQGVFDTTRTTLLALQQTLLALGAEDTRPDIIVPGAAGATS